MRPILLAVSGGPDSLALLVSAAAARGAVAKAGFAVEVATVDHGLRPGSRGEAETVATICAGLDLPHHLLTWAGDKPAGNLQAAARAARYGLLAALGRARGAAAVLTAHHQDDQIETHLLARARGAGDRGLAGMRPRRDLDRGVALLRPFLGVPGARLKARVAGLAAADDPSNRDPRFARIRLRMALDAGGVDRAALLAAIARHAARRDAEDAALAAFLTRLAGEGALALRSDAVLRLSAAALRDAPERLATLLLARAVRAAGGAEHAPDAVAVARLLQRLQAGGLAGATLGGAALAAGADLLVRREEGRGGLAPVAADGLRALRFDARFDVSPPDGGAAFPPGSRVAPFAALGRGNPAERTLPVLLAPDGRLLGAHAALLAKLAASTPVLPARQRIGYRLVQDLQLGHMVNGICEVFA